MPTHFPNTTISEDEQLSCYYMNNEVAKDIINEVENKHEKGLKIMLLEKSQEALNEQTFSAESDTPHSP